MRFSLHKFTADAIGHSCAACSTLLASPALKRVELDNLLGVKQLRFDDPEQRLELLSVIGCKMLNSLHLASPALAMLSANNCCRLRVRACIPTMLLQTGIPCIVDVLVDAGATPLSRVLRGGFLFQVHT